MAKRIVEESSLVSVANAIRTKAELTGSLTFPDGFVSAIGGIKGGVLLSPLVDGSITEVTADMLEGCKKIRPYAFHNCGSLASIAIPSGVTSIGNYAFRGCSSLTSIAIPSGVTSIGNNTFYYCTSLTSIAIPSGVTSIGDNMFYNCTSLTSIVIPSSVTSIKGGAFGFCSSITSIVIPSGVTSIGNYAFRGCSKLATVEMKSTTPPELSSNTFYNCIALKKIIVPAGTLSDYQSATNWSKYANKMVEASA